MKVILLLALFGIAFCQDNNALGSGTESCSGAPAPNPDASDCLNEALKNSVQFLNDISIFLCDYESKGDNNERYRAAAKSFLKAVECTACNVENVLGTGKSVRELINELGEGGADVLGDIEKILSKLEITQELAHALCKVVKIVISPCVQKALKDNLPGLLPALNDLFCKSQKEKAKVVAKKLEGVLKATECVNQETLGNEELGELLETASRFVGSLTKDLLHVVQGAEVLNKLACKVVSLVTGKVGLVGGKGLVNGLGL